MTDGEIEPYYAKLKVCLDNNDPALRMENLKSLASEIRASTSYSARCVSPNDLCGQSPIETEGINESIIVENIHTTLRTEMMLNIAERSVATGKATTISLRIAIGSLIIAFVALVIMIITFINDNKHLEGNHSSAVSSQKYLKSDI